MRTFAISRRRVRLGEIKARQHCDILTRHRTRGQVSLSRLRSSGREIIARRLSDEDLACILVSPTTDPKGNAYVKCPCFKRCTCRGHLCSPWHTCWDGSVVPWGFCLLCVRAKNYR